MKYIFGLHDAGGETLMLDAGRPGWIVFTEELGADPNNHSGRDYRPWADKGLGVIARLNHGYGSAGTLPDGEQHEAFAQRCANWVAASPGCTRWVIGNEPNHPNEWPNGNPITPQRYAMYYTFCRDAILDLPGHETDQVIVAAVAPWCAKCGYAGNVEADWIRYFEDMLRYVGLCDGIAMHAYTHGAHPSLIGSESKMSNPTFAHRMLHFRAYREFMAAIPLAMRSIPVYITESNQGDHGWVDMNTGWVQAAYSEINDWNQQPNIQKIFALCLYRWNDHDQWEIGNKPGVIEDFRQAMRNEYRTPTAAAAGTVQPTAERQATVLVATKLRSAPGYTGRAADNNVILILQPGESIKLLGETANVDSLTWQAVRCRGGLSGWVAERTPGGIQLLDLNPKPVPQRGSYDWAFAWVIGVEGGLSTDRQDRGNWTGGEVGKGEFKGTKYGISAYSYPHLDIANLTVDAAKHIYYQDYWLASKADTLRWDMALLQFDSAVQHHPTQALNFLNMAGQNTLYYLALRIQFYTRIDSWPIYGAAWMERIAKLMKEIGE